MLDVKTIATEVRLAFTRGYRQGWEAMADHTADPIQIRRVGQMSDFVPPGWDPATFQQLTNPSSMTREVYREAFAGFAGIVERFGLNRTAHVRASADASGDDRLLVTIDVWGSLPDGQEIAFAAIKNYAVRDGRFTSFEFCAAHDHYVQGAKLMGLMQLLKMEGAA